MECICTIALHLQHLIFMKNVAINVAFNINFPQSFLLLLLQLFCLHLADSKSGH